MRKVGELPEKSEAFRDLNRALAAANIDYSWEEEADRVELWVLDDDKLSSAKAIFSKLSQGEIDSEIESLVQRGKVALREQKVDSIKEEIRQKKHRIVYSGHSTNISRVCIGVSIFLFVLTQIRPAWAEVAYGSLLLYNPLLGPWQSLASGQVWRLVTPIFLHFGILHIFFNCWWMLDLGRMVEQRLGSLRFLGLLFWIAIPSHLVQGALFGPMFGGLSGVVYGLLGYVWLRSKRDPHCGLELHPQTMMFMMIWLLLGFGVLKNIANGVHVAGLLMGLAAAWIGTKMK